MNHHVIGYGGQYAVLILNDLIAAVHSTVLGKLKGTHQTVKALIALNGVLQGFAVQVVAALDRGIAA